MILAGAHSNAMEARCANASLRDLGISWNESGNVVEWQRIKDAPESDDGGNGLNARGHSSNDFQAMRRVRFPSPAPILSRIFEDRKKCRDAAGVRARQKRRPARLARLSFLHESYRSDELKAAGIASVVRQARRA